jgi:AraC-like DNA-binding protein
VLLLDTGELPAAQRLDAFHAAHTRWASPSRVDVEDAAAEFRTRLDTWSLGSARIYTHRGSGVRMMRTARHVRTVSNPSIALAVMVHGHGRFGHAAHQHLVGAADLMLVDLTAPYEFGWSGEGASFAVQLPIDTLRLPMDAVRRASGNLQASPLYELVHQQILGVTTRAAQLSTDPAAVEIGAATAQLGRALIASAAGTDRHAREALADSLLTRVLTFVDQHLTEPDLTATRIARQHSISVRHLYKLCAEADVSLEQRIISNRLQGARSALAAPAGRHRTIASIAHAWGFTSPAHFHRRFRQAYGITPGDWQRAQR